MESFYALENQVFKSKLTLAFVWLENKNKSRLLNY